MRTPPIAKEEEEIMMIITENFFIFLPAQTLQVLY
jgi:hypothetical protein